jgi:Ca-activated chloride channel family protein
MKTLLLILCALFTVTHLSAQNASVTVLNPQAQWQSQTAVIDSASFFVTPAGLNTQVAFYATLNTGNWGYSSNVSTNLEFVYRFYLPADALVTDMWLWVEGKIMKAYLLDQFTATQIYEGIVNRNRDPALLKKINDTTYEIRVFPVWPNATRKIKIEFQLPQQVNAQTAVTAINLRNILPQNGNTRTTFALYKPTGWGTPVINQPSNPEMVEVQSAGGTFQQHTVANVNAQIPIEITYQNPGGSSGLFASYGTSGSSGTYELAVQASRLFNLSKDRSRKLLFVLDEDPGKTTVTRATLKAELIAFGKRELAAADSFMVVTSGLQPWVASDTWISASDTSRIRQTFDYAFTKMVNFSSLANALQSALQFANLHGKDATIVLAAATDQYGTLNSANALIDAIRVTSQAVYPFFILDYANSSLVQSNNIGGVNYRGNGYLYSYLSSVTKGDFRYIGTSPLGTALTQLAEKLAGTITAFDVHVGTQDGFTYGKFTNEATSLGYNTLYYQTGKFEGSWPLRVSASGLFNGKVVSHQFQIERASAVDLGNYVSRSWSGKMIRKLTNDGSQTAATEALRLSLSERILSKYTAFLALEPADTVKACVDCIDETAFLPLEDVKKEAFADSIRVFPNPFNATTSIYISLPQNWSHRDVKVEIYSITGQRVYAFPSSAFTGRLFTLHWNAGGFATGVYMLRLRHPLGVRSAKLVLVK